MSRGIVLGLLCQVVGAVGFILVMGVTSVKSALMRTCLTLGASGLVALGIAGYLFLSGKEQPPRLVRRDILSFVLGSVLALVVGHVLYFKGLALTNVTTMAYTTLAYPIVSLVLELVLGRVKPSALTLHDLAGFGLMAAGYVIIMSKG